MSADLVVLLRKARRRLNFSHFLAVASWSLFATLLAGAGVLLLDKVLPLGVPVLAVIGGSLAGGLLLACGITWFTSRSEAQAAQAIDEAFGLKERVSTLMSLPAEQLASPAGVALREDVEKRTKELAIDEKMPLRKPRYSWLPMIAFALLVAATFLGPFQWAATAKANTFTETERKKAVEQTAVLAKKLEERKKKAEEGTAKGDEQLKELAAKVDNLAKDLKDNPKLTPQEAVLKLSDLAKGLESRKQKMESLEKLKQALSKMPNMKDGPAEKLSNALKNGDFQEATKKLEEMRKAFEKGGMDAEKRKELGKQLAQIQKSLKDAANLKKREEELRKNISDPKQLAKELAKLKEDAKKLEKLEKLAQKLQQCSECCKGGEKMSSADQQQMAMALKDAEKELKDIAKDEKMRQMINEMIDDLAETRSCMCKGDPDELKNRRSMYNQGGVGMGPRDEAPDETRSRLTKAETQQNKGRAFVAGQTEGRNFRGDSKLEIREMAARASEAVEKSVTRQKVPAEYRRHTQEYFDKLNKGLDE